MSLRSARKSSRGMPTVRLNTVSPETMDTIDAVMSEVDEDKIQE